LGSNGILYKVITYIVHERVSIMIQSEVDTVST